MYCPNCGSQIDEKSKFCMNCGANLADYRSDDHNEDNVPISMEPISHTEQKEELRCRFCGSTNIDYEDKFGVYCRNCDKLLYPKTKSVNPYSQSNGATANTVTSKKKKLRFGWLIPVGLIAVGIIFFIGINAGDKSESLRPDQTEQVEISVESQPEDKSELEPIEESKELPIIERLVSDMGDDALASHVYSIMTEEVGFSNLTYIERIELTDNYQFKNGSTAVIATAFADEEGEFIRIFTPHGAVYYEDGELLVTQEQVDADKLDIGKISTYQVMAQNAVEQVLKDPSTAGFTNINAGAPSISAKDGIVAVQGYVTATNSFGAREKELYTVEFKPIDLSTYSYELLYLQVGSITQGTYIDLN